MSVFKRRRFLAEIILLCVRWYCRYGISYRELEEMMAERGVAVDHRLSICTFLSYFLLFLAGRFPAVGGWLRYRARI
jgi:hypothetical protein